MRVLRQKKRPKRLPEKLLEIRMKLGLSQGEMSRRLGGDNAERAYISKYERAVLEPPLELLLEYARAISTTGRGEFLETLIDDSLDLPTHIPADPSKFFNRRNKS
ncbi:MAG TPA: helix-turn-helix domain-containing protein [Pyrinomonadaceae bacterium]|nr:helix-turn-helix domain-containing protein [Pyrinomonadaceae bacterium]